MERKIREMSEMRMETRRKDGSNNGITLKGRYDEKNMVKGKKENRLMAGERTCLKHEGRKGRKAGRKVRKERRETVR